MPAGVKRTMRARLRIDLARDQPALRALVDQFAHRLLAHRGAARKLGQPRAVDVEIAGEADMGDARRAVTAGRHEFENPRLEPAHRIVEQPADIGVTPCGRRRLGRTCLR
jgi:hypothetical protein